METKEQCYSIDNERYSDYEDMIHDLTEYYDIGESVEVWVAEKKYYANSDFIDADDLIYRMQCHAHDICGSEVTENYLVDISGDMANDLKSHIAEWFNKNAKINFYGVENEHKIMVVVE